jgi:hypothetical protein
VLILAELYLHVVVARGRRPHFDHEEQRDAEDL